MRACLAAAVAATCLLFSATPASAGLLSKVGTTYVYTASGTELNDFTVTDTGTDLVFDETFAPTVSVDGGSGCSGGGAGAATCPEAGITAIVVDLEDNNDKLTVNGSVTIPVQADGGAGDDTLLGGAGSDDLDGDAGADIVDGSNGTDVVHGGEGLDRVTGGNGADQVFGDGGNDLFDMEAGTDVLSGGTGVDTLYIYGGSAVPVPWTLDDVANDGLAPDIANVRSDIEELVADFFMQPATLDARLTGNDQANTLRGGEGDDIVDGLGGSDVLTGGGGDDVIQARDGAIDRVACGAGSDSATVDADDLVEECETVSRSTGPAPTSPPVAADDAAPRVAFLAPAMDTLLDPRRANAVAVDASDDRGVDRVVLFDDGRPVGIDATAPYTFDYAPGGEDVGSNTLVAVAYDSAGQTASDIRALRLDRFAARSLSLRVSPTRDRRAAYRFTASGRLTLPAQVARALGCAGGQVAVTIKRGRRTVSSRRATLRRDCTYRSTVTFASRARLGSGRLRVTARFLGNSVLRSTSAAGRTVRAG